MGVRPIQMDDMVMLSLVVVVAVDAPLSVKCEKSLLSRYCLCTRDCMFFFITLTHLERAVTKKNTRHNTKRMILLSLSFKHTRHTTEKNGKISLSKIPTYENIGLKYVAHTFFVLSQI